MAKPSSRQELAEYALRKLGAPVLEINIADEQLDDAIDDTIQYFQERHYDGTIRTYLRYEFTDEDIQRGRAGLNVGTASTTSVYPGDTAATATNYTELSSYIKIPDHIIGIERVFTPMEATGSGYIYAGYPNLIGPDGALADTQFGLSSLYGFGSYDMISYYVAKSWWETISHLLSPEAQIRFNKRQDRLYLDINWSSLRAGQFIIVDCYRALDPEHFCEIYNDTWVKKYLVALLKKQWGQNLIKFRGTKLPGGIEMNGREIYEDGIRELEAIRQDMSSWYELPPLDMIG